MKQKSKQQIPVTPEGPFHGIENQITLPIFKDLDKNIENVDMLFKDCMDVVKRKVEIGGMRPLKIYGVYIDGMVNRNIIEEFFLTRIIDYKNLNGEIVQSDKTPTEIVMQNFSATFDIKEVDKMDDAIKAILSGDTALFVDNSDKVLVMATRGWPARGISESESESVVRGPKDGFTETIRFNTVLVRRRIRDTKLKVKMISFGTRSRTDVAVMYVEDIAKPELVEEVFRRLNKYEIDAIYDSGYIEQLIEDSWKSPFPQTQATERPDKVASSLLEGKVAIIVDNSPAAIIVPTTLNSFYQASEDYYQRWHIMSYTRLLRYLVSFLAFTLPGLYIATLNFQTAMLPTPFAISIAASREGITFTTVVEIVIMELAFELFREAGIRIPGAIGHVIGLVGGIIIGQAAVDAKIISPMIVIIVALTAISTFAIPDYNLISAFTLTRYLFIALSALLGLYGFLLAFLLLTVHLASLESFKTPFMAPYNISELNKFGDLKDTLLRFPTFMQNTRPIYARDRQRCRLRLKNQRQYQSNGQGTSSNSLTDMPPGPDSDTANQE